MLIFVLLRMKDSAFSFVLQRNCAKSIGEWQISLQLLMRALGKKNQLPAEAVDDGCGEAKKNGRRTEQSLPTTERADVRQSSVQSSSRSTHAFCSSARQRSDGKVRSRHRQTAQP